MDIPQLHTNLLWDLSCLIIALTVLYFSGIHFLKRAFWKSIVALSLSLKWAYFEKFSSLGIRDKGVNDPKDITIQGYMEMGPEMDQDNSINDIEVYYEVLIDPAIEKQIHEILQSYAVEQREKEIIFFKDNEGNDRYMDEGDVFDFGDIALPPARFYNKKEHKRVKLLFTIAELGDVREVPLLQRMLDKEENESIAILIKEIILGFLSERPRDRKGEAESHEIGPFYGNYVYNYLFQAIDAESQLLLMDEILKIGGTEELAFLRTLTSHPDGAIREKAGATTNRPEQEPDSPWHNSIVKNKGRRKVYSAGILFARRIYLRFIKKIAIIFPKFGLAFKRKDN